MNTRQTTRAAAADALASIRAKVAAHRAPPALPAAPEPTETPSEALARSTADKLNGPRARAREALTPAEREMYARAWPDGPAP